MWRTILLALLLTVFLVTFAVVAIVWTTRPVLAQVVEPATFRPDAGEAVHLVQRLRGWILYDGAGQQIGRVLTVDGATDFTVIFDEVRHDE